MSPSDFPDHPGSILYRSESSQVPLFYKTVTGQEPFFAVSNTYHVSVYKSLKEATEKHSDVDVLVNFASLRSAYDVTLEAIKIDQLRTIAIIAEGIPENMTRTLNKKAKDKGVIIIGPATVGGIKPGCFRIGNTGGMMDNIIRCKLYRPGNVAYVSRSGI